jgi:hypothetical protein
MEAMTSPPAEVCGKCATRRPRHTIYQDGAKLRLCCACNYTETGDAADWHPECLEAAVSDDIEALIPFIAADDESDPVAYTRARTTAPAPRAATRSRGLPLRSRP